jgi:hypothetical protein
VVEDLCETPSLENVFSVLEMCRVSSTFTSKGFIVDKIEEAIKQAGSCGEINDDIDDLTIAGQLDLQDKCEDKLDGMIEWHEFDDKKDDTKDDTKHEPDGGNDKHDTKDEKSEKKNKKKKDEKAGYNINGGRKLREVLPKEAKSN